MGSNETWRYRCAEPRLRRPRESKVGLGGSKVELLSPGLVIGASNWQIVTDISACDRLRGAP